MSKHLPEKHNRVHPFHSLMRSFWDDDFSLLDEALFSREKKGGLSLSEDENHVYVEANLAGLSDNEIDVTLDKGVLWIRGEKKEEKDERKYHHKAYRSYSYKVALPESVNSESQPDAEYKKGILTVKFNKAKGEPARKINVKHHD